MSYPILNTNINWKLESFKKTPVFNTIVQRNAADRGNSATSTKPFPTWDFNVELPTNVSSLLASSSIISQFLGCFGQSQGRNGLFLYSDDTDNMVNSALSGMLDVTSNSATPMHNGGNGTSTQFQLVRSLGGLAWDVIQNLNNTPTIYINAVSQSGSTYSISSTGVITFNTAPSNGATLGWSGTFYFLCRFSDDSFKDLSMVGYNASGPLWQCTNIAFSSEYV